MRFIKENNRGRKNYYFRSNWLEFYPKFSAPKFEIEKAGHFDERPMIMFNASYLLLFVSIPLMITYSVPAYLFVPIVLLQLIVGWGRAYLHLPIKTGIDGCDSPSWGFYYHASSLVICKGKKKKFIHMPWDYSWIRTSYLKFDGSWLNETKDKTIDHWQDQYKTIIFKEQHPFTYVLPNQEIQRCTATIGVSEREWRPRWFKWTKLFAKVRKSIDIDFSEEIGSRAGSWKGGVTGCSWNMKPLESPLQTLRRMQRERSFDR
jgi:hypothetical protein